MDKFLVENIDSVPFEELLCAADKARREGTGRKLELCGIVNAKCGACGEDCKFCVQSAHYFSDIERYPLKSRKEIVSAAFEAKANGAVRFGIVTSGNRLSREEIKVVAGAVRDVREKAGVTPCASLGAIDKESFSILKDAGLTRYHHNIETSERFYPSIVSTHEYAERINTVETARKMELEVCSGGIIGLGETWQDRRDMAALLRELEVDSVPLNFLIPMKGTPLENTKLISAFDAARTIALFRLMLKDKAIKVAAGRERVLGDDQGLMYKAGANGMMVGGYLTMAGRPVEDDKVLIEEVQRSWNEE